MATYDYKCEDGHLSEENHPIKDEIHVITCHECGKEANRIISSRPFIFKCGGFYRTDYERQYNTTAGTED
jgi:putative FmdB family regulatory protein